MPSHHYECARKRVQEEQRQEHQREYYGMYEIGKAVTQAWNHKIFSGGEPGKQGKESRYHQGDCTPPYGVEEHPRVHSGYSQLPLISFAWPCLGIDICR